MQTLSHQQLNGQQLAQIEYLFADSIFGTDPSAYAYSLNTSGDVTGRTETDGPKTMTGRSRNTPVMVHMLEEVNITKTMIAFAQRSMDALAASIAEKLFQSHQIEEEVTT